MNTRTLVTGLFGALAVFLMVFLWLKWLTPARELLGTQQEAAETKLSDVQRMRPEWVGTAYASDLGAAKEIGRSVLKRLGDRLAAEAAQLTVSVDREQGGSEAERMSRYVGAYRWAQDELRRAMRGHLSGFGVEPERELPLRNPDALRGRRGIRSLEEIPPLDRAFQIESLVLLAASRAGAYPVSELQVQDAWQSAPEGTPFVEAKVSALLVLQPKALPLLLRELASLEGKGPTVRIDHVTTSPIELPETATPDGVARIQDVVRLALLCYRGKA